MVDLLGARFGFVYTWVGHFNADLFDGRTGVRLVNRSNSERFLARTIKVWGSRELQPESSSKSTNLFEPGVLQREGGVDPAVRVQQFTGYVVFRNAVDRIAEVLSGGHHQTERDQDDHAELVVQSEHMIVDDAALRFDERFKIAE